MKLLRLFVFISLLITTSMLSTWNISAQAPPPTPVGPLKSDDPPPQAPSKIERLAAGEFSVDSKVGWQQTSLSLQKGDTFKIKYVSGTWTVDYRSFTYVGPKGYTPKEDKQIFQGCKLISSWVYARLVGKVGNGAIFPVDQGGSFKANASGELSLRIHDMDACLVDNDGSVIVKMEGGSKNLSSFLLPWDQNISEGIVFTGGPHAQGIFPKCPNEPINNKVQSGLDFGIPAGGPVLSVAPGKILSSVDEDIGSKGKYVVIEHPDGRITEYWHLEMVDQFVKDNKGKDIPRGQLLGKAGETGTGADSPHLHLELQQNTPKGKEALSWNNQVIDGWTVHVSYADDPGVIGEDGTPTKGKASPRNYEGTMTKGIRSGPKHDTLKCMSGKKEKTYELWRVVGPTNSSLDTAIADVPNGTRLISSNQQK